MILRRWIGRIRTADQHAYAAYIEETGGAAYLATPGNLGWQMLFREVGEGLTEVSTLSWWTDLAAIRAFAGEAYEQAVFYPEDDRFLVERGERVDHFAVAAGEGPRAA